MQSYRNNPDSGENAAMTRDNERAVFAAKMQGTAIVPEVLWQHWQGMAEADRLEVARETFCRTFGYCLELRAEEHAQDFFNRVERSMARVEEASV